MITIGIDEVGRGCLAGDLVVCAYAFAFAAGSPERTAAEDLAMDSKAFSTRAKRERAEVVIRRAGLFETVRRTPGEIDTMNIRQATMSAMAEAASRLASRLTDPDVVAIFDGKDLPDVNFPAEAVVKGDASVCEISCASIIAKVLRDKEMDQLALCHAGYGFERNAGYGTAEHREAIGRMGLLPCHRSWARKFTVSEQV